MKLRYLSIVTLEIIFLHFFQISSSTVHAQSGQVGFSSVITDKRSAGTISHASFLGIGDSQQNWLPNEWAGYFVSLTNTNRPTQIRKIIGNSATALTVSPAFDCIPNNSSGYAIRRGYKGASQGLKLKLYMQYNDANIAGGKLEDYSCRIQTSDSTAVEFVSVELGNGLGKEWTPSYYAPQASGTINWLVLQIPNYVGLASGFYNIATVTFNLLKTDVDKPITFFLGNCPQGGSPIGITLDHNSIYFDTTTNTLLSGREEFVVLHDTSATEPLFASKTSVTTSAIGSYPNPFNPSTTLRYDLNEYSEVQLVVFDLRGRMVGELVHAQQYEGSHSVRWDPINLSSGIYFARVNVRGLLTNYTSSQSIKLVYAK
jgi:hypothetical protein